MNRTFSKEAVLEVGEMSNHKPYDSLRFIKTGFCETVQPKHYRDPTHMNDSLTIRTHVTSGLTKSTMLKDG